MNYSQWFKQNYHELTAAGVALRGGELGTMSPEEFHSRPYRFLMSRLSTYFDVGDSFTHNFLYELAASCPELAPDLSYLPSEKDGRVMDEHQVPWLLGNQSKYEAKDFHLIGFSNSIVQELINIPVLLKKSGFPLSKIERMEREDLPLIIMGGASAPWSQILWHEDSWVDGLFLGENPHLIKKIFTIFVEGKKTGLSKKAILKNLAEIPGFFLPEEGLGAKKVHYCDKEEVTLYSKGLAPYGEDFLSQGHLHISEGCRGFCSFCAENWARKPYTEFSKEKLLDTALSLKKNLGLSKINLFSFNFNMHKDLEPLLLSLIENFNSIGLKSQRFDMLAEHPELLEIEKLIGKMNLSAGLEGISHRMRAYLNKNLSEKDFLKSLNHIFKMKAQELKLFVIATGKETEEDFDEFANLLQKIAKERQLAFAHTRLVFSVTPLVRFAGTPLEFDTCPAIDEVRRTVRRIEKIVSLSKFEARSAMEADEYLFSQLLMRGKGKAFTETLLELSERFQFVYYSEVPAPLVSCFVQFLGAKGIDIKDLLRLQEYKMEETPILDMGIKRDFLWRTFEKNSAFEEIGSLDVIKKKTDKKFSPKLFKEKLEQLKAREQDFHFHVSWKDELKGLEHEYRAQILASALMKAEPKLVPLYRDFISSYWKEERYLCGEDLLALRFFKEALPLLTNLKTEIVSKELERYGTYLGMKTTLPIAHSFTVCFDEKPQLDLYLKGEGLKHTLMKRDGKSLFEFSKDSLKKDIVKSIVLGEELEIIPGRKFLIGDFLKKSFGGASKNLWLRSTARGKLNFS